MTAVQPTVPTSSLAAIYDLETSFQTIDQQYQTLKTRLNLSCEESDEAKCLKAAQLNASLRVLIANMIAALKPDSLAQQLRLERRQATLEDEYTTLTAGLKDAGIMVGMYNARFLCYTLGFFFIVGLIMKH